MNPNVNPPHIANTIRKRWEEGDDEGEWDDGDVAAAANVWVKSLASRQIVVKTEGESRVARLVTAPLVTR